MKYVIAIIVLAAYLVVVHFVGKFCGFNQLGHDE